MTSDIQKRNAVAVQATLELQERRIQELEAQVATVVGLITGFQGDVQQLRLTLGQAIQQSRGHGSTV